MRLFQTTLLMVAVVVVTGCCRVPRPQTGPSSAEDLLGALRAGQSAQTPTIRGEVRVDSRGPEGRIAGKVYAFAAAGGRLRFEAVSPMDTPLRTVAVDGDDGPFTMTDQESQRCVEGQAQPCLVGDAIGIALDASHVVTVLLGGAPLIRHGEVTADWNRCGFFEVHLEGEQEGWSETVHLAPHEGGELVVVSASIRGPEGVVLEIEHEDFRAMEGRLLPESTTIRTPQAEGDLQVMWRSIEVGVDLPDRAWQATCPTGFAVEPASCAVTSGSMPDLESVEPPTVPEPEDGGEEGGEESPGGDLSEELGL